MDLIILVVVLVACVSALLLACVAIMYLQFYWGVRAAGVRLPLWRIVALRWNGIDAEAIAHALILAKESDMEIDYNFLVEHAEAGGDPVKAAISLIVAHENGDDFVVIDDF